MQIRSSTSDNNRLSSQLPVHVPGDRPLSPTPFDKSPVDRQSNDTAPTFTVSGPVGGTVSDSVPSQALGHVSVPGSSQAATTDPTTKPFVFPRMPTKADVTSASSQPRDLPIAAKLSVPVRWLPKVPPQTQALHRDEFLAFHGKQRICKLPTTVAAFNAAHGTRLETKVVRNWVIEMRKRAAPTEQVHVRHRRPVNQSHHQTHGVSSETNSSALTVPANPEASTSQSQPLMTARAMRAQFRVYAALPPILLAPHEEIPKPGLPAEAYRNVLVETFRNWDRPLKEVIDAVNHNYKTDISHIDARRWVAREQLLAKRLIPKMTEFFEKYGLMDSVQARSHACFPPGQVSENAVHEAWTEARRRNDARANALVMPVQIKLQSGPAELQSTRLLTESRPGVFTDPITGVSYDIVPRPPSPATAPVSGARLVQQATNVLTVPSGPSDATSDFDEDDHASVQQGSLMGLDLDLDLDLGLDVDDLAAELAAEMGTDLFSAMSEPANANNKPDASRADHDFDDVWAWINADPRTPFSVTTRPGPGPRSPGSTLAPSGPIDDFDWGFL
ncbi:hypothetical protein BH09PSE5_BH09PSE5_13030 [soil metagenome]